LQACDNEIGCSSWQRLLCGTRGKGVKWALREGRRKELARGINFLFTPCLFLFAS
jgi:hypothetical protein